MSETVDFIVAGAGHNSLICAAYLARAGLRLLVLESRPQLGGSTSTEALTLPGFQHDSCATAHPVLVGSPIIRDDELGLIGQYGLTYVKPDPVVTVPFADGSSLTMWRDIDRTVAEIARFSARDADRYRHLIQDYRNIRRYTGRYRYTPIGYGPSLDELLARRLDGPLWLRRYRQSADEVLQAYFSEAHVRTFMIWLASLPAQPTDEAFSGLVPYSIIYGRQENSWAAPVGGSQALPAALERLLLDHGATIVTDQTVTELILEGERCVGVRTAAGDSFRARHGVISTIHIKQLVEMAPAANWGHFFLQGLEQWQPGLTLFVHHYALTEPPLYQIEGAWQPAAAAGILGTGDDLVGQMAAHRQGRIYEGFPAMTVVSASVADPSRAPAGQHTLKILTYYPYNLADGGPARWDEIKESVADRDLAQVRRFVPNLTDEVILARQVHSPLDLERWNRHNWRGSCHGGALSPSQMGAMRPVPGWASHRMPIKGLYQTGATTHPGGSVTGAPGRNAAWVILDDLGRSLAEVVAHPRA